LPEEAPKKVHLVYKDLPDVDVADRSKSSART
jgi:hypothetical protein